MRNSPRNETRSVKSRGQLQHALAHLLEKIPPARLGDERLPVRVHRAHQRDDPAHGLALVYQGKNNPGLHRFLFHGFQAEPAGAVQVFYPGQVHFQA